MSTAPSTPYASASLYVGDLVPDVSEALLFEIFNAVGPVASVRVCRDAATRRSLGYAYVNFHRVDDAERALDTMNFKNIRNRPCRIMWSHRDPSLRKSGVGNIFVKNLAKSIDNKSLYDTFSMFGNILSCKVAVNSKRESLGYGFVHYESEEAAQNAIQRVDGKVIAGEKVSVSAFKSKKERGGNTKFKFTNIYVKNLPPDFTKERLDEMVGKYGVVTSSMLPLDKEGKAKGFGFVNFAAPEEAAAAVDALNEIEVEGKKLYVARAQKREEREKELRDRFEQLKVERQKKYAGVNLYVKNLADDIDDDRLREEFAKFGNITSAKVMRDSTGDKTNPGPSKGFGFVCFSTPEEATKAVTEMNGRMLERKPLYVALAQRKEVRRAQLEAQHAARAKLGVPQPQMYPPQVQGAPMFYQAGIPQRNFVYPQQMIPRRWAPGQGGPQMMGVRHPINYQLMPINGRPAPGGAQPNRGGGRRQRQQGGAAAGPQGMQRQGQQQQGGPQNYKYTDNVRNRDQRAPQQMPQQAPGPEVPVQAALPTPNTEPLTIKALAAASEDQKKQMIGERLFPLIKQQQPKLAGKITGMLLEMDNGELIHLLESPAALREKIDEALAVLQEADGDVDKAE